MVKNPNYKNVTAVGAGAITEEQSRPDPLLNNVSAFHYVKVTNILPLDFIGKVAQSRQVNVPLSVNDTTGTGINEEVIKMGGIPTRNPDHPSFVHTSVNVPIKAGQTLNLRGDEAKVIVRQLVNEAMAYEGQTIRRGNPAYRLEYEKRIVQGVYDINNLLGEQHTRDALIDEALKKEDEKAFPTLEKPEETLKKEKK